ncbi:MAG: hypothetical protein ACLRY5_07335 [Zhenhengia sp.]
MCNIGKCRLCEAEEIELKESHIVPKFFYNYIKKNSPANGLRTTQDPNQRVQDGLKLYFLCNECEQLFSKYERKFNQLVFQPISENPLECSIDTKYDEIAYFLLSVAWRSILCEYEKDEEALDMTDIERERLGQILEEWRQILKDEQLNKLEKKEMYMIPTEKLEVFEQSRHNRNNVSITYKIFGREDQFDWAFSCIQVPHLLFVVNTWNSNDKRMKANQIGKVIKARKTRLPKELERVIDGFLVQFYDAKDRISDKQIENIRKTVEKKQQSKQPPTT